MTVLAIAHDTSRRITEVGFLLYAIAGVWLVAAEVLPEKWRRFRIIVSGLLIAVGSVLLIMVAHSGTLA